MEIHKILPGKVNPVMVCNTLNIFEGLTFKTTDVGTLCKNAKSKWSKRKPVSYAQATDIYGVDGLSETVLRSVNYGLQATKIDRSTLATTEWTYIRPTGGITISPYRLTDFRAYNVDAKPFMRIDDVLWNPNTTNVDSLTITPTYKFGTNSYDGNVQANSGQSTAGIEIYPQDLLAVLSNTTIANMYLGIATKDVIGGNTIEGVFSPAKINQATSPALMTITPASNANIKTHLNNMMNGATLEFTPFFCPNNLMDSWTANDDKYSLPLGLKFKIKKEVPIYFTFYMQSLSFVSSNPGLTGLGGPNVYNAPGTSPISEGSITPVLSGNSSGMFRPLSTTTASYKYIKFNAIVLFRNLGNTGGPIIISRSDFKISAFGFSVQAASWTNTEGGSSADNITIPNDGMYHRVVINGEFTTTAECYDVLRSLTPASVSNPEWNQTGAVPSSALRAVSGGLKYQGVEMNTGNSGVVWIDD
nr:hypothetical protein [uncultured Macellibacteroides sp.]